MNHTGFLLACTEDLHVWINVAADPTKVGYHVSPNTSFIVYRPAGRLARNLAAKSAP
jgi:hypothetical protein